MKYILIFFVLVGSVFATEEVPSKEEVAKLYVATFNRAPDSAGLEYWVYDSDLTLSQIAQSFFEQNETQTLYPPSVTNREFIKSVYANLFNREPDSAGWDYWEEQLNEGIFSKNRFIEAVINGALGDDAVILSNKTEVGLSFADAGLSDVQQAKDIMSNVNATTKSVTLAKEYIKKILSDNSIRTKSVNPLTLGSDPVACSYFIFKDDSPVNEDLIPYLSGDSDGKYISDVLKDSAIKIEIMVPDSEYLYGEYANRTMEYIGIAYYPTKDDPSYQPLQTISGWEHPSTLAQMESSVDATPIFADDTKKYPLIVYSHGLGAEDITIGELLKAYASYGFFVLGIYHGDNRFNDRKGNEINALRPLAIKNAIDFLESSKYAQHIDFDKIIAIGNSSGGATALMLIGGKPIDMVALDGSVAKDTVEDERIKLAIGIEPYMGNSTDFPKLNGVQVTFFGYDGIGATSLNAPYLAVSGSADQDANETFIKMVLSKAPLNNYLVSMEGETHDISNQGSDTANTWALYFIKYILENDDTFIKIKDVSGNPVDSYIKLD